MAEDRRFIIEIRSKGFQKARRGLVQVKQDADKLAAATKVAEGQTRSHIAAMNKGGGIMATFRRESSALRNNMLLFTFAIGGTIAAINNLVKAFADAQDTTNRFRAVFKELAPEAEAFATSFGQKFGFARIEVMKMMETFQGLFVPLGFSRDAAAGLSEAMVKLSMDVGSFRDVDPTQVAQMFTSALIGNHEAVRRLNIALTENSVKNAAVNNGFALSRNLVSDQAKVMGRFAEILRQTTDAQGDMSRTMDDYNNRARRLNQQTIELRQNMGEAAMPIAEVGIGIGEMIAKTEVLVPTLLASAAAFIGARAAVALYTTAVYGATAAAAMGAGPVGVFVAGISGVTLAATSLFAKFKKDDEDIVRFTKRILGLGESNKQLEEKLGGVNDEAQKSFMHYSGLKDAAKNVSDATDDLTTNKEKEDALVKKITKDINVEHQHKLMMIEATKELREAAAKRNTTLAVEAMLVGETSRMAKEMIKARLEENRALSKTEIKLIAMIEQRKVDAEAAKEEAKAIKDSADALKTRLEDLQIEAATMDTNSALIKATVEARIRENRELTTGEISLLRHIDSLRIEQDAIQASISAIHSRSDAIRTLGEDLNEISITNQAFMISQITGSKELGQLDELRTRTIQKMIDTAKALGMTEIPFVTEFTLVIDELTEKAGDAFNLADATFEAKSNIVDLKKELSDLTMAELLTKDFDALITTWYDFTHPEADEEGKLSTEGLVSALKKLQIQAAEAGFKIVDVGDNLKSTSDAANQTASAILSAASAMRVFINDTATAEQKMAALLNVMGMMIAKFGGPEGKVAGSLMQATSMFIGHKGGLVQDTGIQQFATGGMVRGQDNVPIMAQAGEFIMRRSAVQNIGVQNLAEMNKTGSTGGLTINIAGDLIGDEDHVRTKVLPAIKNELRREANA